MVLVDGALALFVERGGRSLLSFTADPPVLQAAAAALAGLVTDRRVDAIVVERIDGATVLVVRDDPVQAALTAAGFGRTPRGLRLRE